MKCVVKNNSSMDMGPLLPLLKSLLPYSREKLGFNRPPSLFFASDTENAAKPLGKTAFYDPGAASITIFVDGRHPKDILRSISHELVHHMQHERGDFGTDMDTGEGYAQKNDALRELEREAYESGNMCFRDWEDENKHALQEAKQHFYRKNKKMSAYDKRNDKIESLLMEKWGFKAKSSDVDLIQEESNRKWTDNLILGASAVTDFVVGTDYKDDYLKKITPPKEIEPEAPDPELEALRATDVYRDTMAGKRGAIDATALGDMTTAQRDVTSAQLGRDLDLSPAELSPDAGEVTPEQEEEWKKGATNSINTIRTLLTRSDDVSREVAVSALLNNDEIKTGLQSTGANRIPYIARIRKPDGEYLFNTVEDFLKLTLEENDPKKVELVAELDKIIADIDKESSEHAALAMADVYGVSMDGVMLDRTKKEPHPLVPPVRLPDWMGGWGEGSGNPKRDKILAGVEVIEDKLEAGFVCKDGSYGDEASCAAADQIPYGAKEADADRLKIAQSVEGASPMRTGGPLILRVGAHEIDSFGLKRAGRRGGAMRTGPVYGMKRHPNMPDLPAAQQRQRDQHFSGQSASQLIADNLAANKRVALEEAGLKKGSKEYKAAAREFDKRYPIGQLLAAYNMQVAEERADGAEKGTIDATLPHDEFAREVAMSVRNGYMTNRHGIRIPGREGKLSPTLAGTTFDEILSTDFGKEIIMPPDFSRESQLWYKYAKEEFNKIKTPKDLEVWKAKMRNDRRPQIDSMHKRKRDIGGRWSNAAMTRRNRAYLVRKVIFAAKRRGAGGPKGTGLIGYVALDHAEPKDGYGKPAGRREDDITREALIRKVVQEALKRKFGE